MHQHAKDPYKCVGGPFDGGVIHLSVNGDRKSVVFTAGGYRGRYVGPPGRSNYSGKGARNKRVLPATWESVP